MKQKKEYKPIDHYINKDQLNKEMTNTYLAEFTIVRKRVVNAVMACKNKTEFYVLAESIRYQSHSFMEQDVMESIIHQVEKMEVFDSKRIDSSIIIPNGYEQYICINKIIGTLGDYDQCVILGKLIDKNIKELFDNKQKERK